MTSYAVTFLVAGFAVGWREAYDLSLGIMSPASASRPLAAWPVSIAGWLVAPGLAGAVAGYLVSASIGAQRKKPVGELFAEDSR